MQEKLAAYAESIESRLRGKKVGVLYAETHDSERIVRTTREGIVATLDDLHIATRDIQFFPERIGSLPDLLEAIREVDLVCKVVHGTINRIGLLQGLLNVCRKPFTGHDLETDLLSQNKIFGKSVMGARGINTPRWIFATGQDMNLVDEFIKETGARQFVIKPIGTNSSKGIMFAESPEVLKRLLGELPSQYGEYFVEEFILGRVVTMGVIPCGEELLTTPPLEYVLEEGSALMDASWKTNPVRVTAGNLGSDAVEKMEAWSRFLHQGISARGITRSDFIVDREDKTYALEINSNVGLSETHDVPTAAAIAGVPYKDLVLVHLGTAGSF